jgi:hypothetical protein
LLHTVVEASLSVQNLVQTTVWPTTDDQLKVALRRVPYGLASPTSSHDQCHGPDWDPVAVAPQLNFV